MSIEQAALEVQGYAFSAGQRIEWAAANIEQTLTAPHVVMRARVFLDQPGVWCCMYGECLADSPAGFGDSPARACADFDRRWLWSQAEIDAHDKAKEGKA